MFYKSLEIYPEGKFKTTANLNFLAELKSLQELFLYFTKTVDLTILEKCDKLKYLDLTKTKAKTAVDLSTSFALETIIFDDQKNLKSIYSNPSVSNVTVFNFEGEDLSVLKDMKNLKKLHIHNSKNLFSLKGLDLIDNLEIIELNNCMNLSNITSFSILDRKITLRVNGEKIYRENDLSPNEVLTIEEKFGSDRIDTNFNVNVKNK